MKIFKIIPKLFSLLTLTILLSLCLSCGVKKEVNPGFDFTGIDKFLSITETLMKNKEPGVKDWDELFQTPGYKLIRMNEISDYFFQKSFRYVFKPSLKDSLKYELSKANSIKKRFINHYLDVRERRAEVVAQVKKLKNTPIARTAAKNALEFLPIKELTDYPQVAFLIFDDGIRNFPVICVDVLHSVEMGDELPLMLAREYFLRMRGSLLKFDPADVRAEDQPLIRALENMLSGGTADYIYKKDLLINRPYESLQPMDQVYMDNYRNAPEIIHTLDKFLTLMIDDPSHYAGYTAQFKKALPMDGNPVGFYMVEVICKAGGQASLIRQIANPFDFLWIYNAAAKNRPGEYPVFSDKALSVTQILKRKYLK